MPTRTTLTKTMANSIRQARTTAGLSQYELAEKLGWVRSKIKRIEKFETRSIDEKDLKALTAALSMETPEGATPTKKAPKSAKKTPTVRRPATKTTSPSEGTQIEWVEHPNHADLFEKISAVPRKSRLKFFKVKFLRGVSTRELFQTTVTIDGVRGRIHGVETNAGQGSIIKTGDKLVIGIFPDA